MLPSHDLRMAAGPARAQSLRGGVRVGHAQGCQERTKVTSEQARKKHKLRQAVVNERRVRRFTGSRQYIRVGLVP